ncbi:DUF5518 domain-containing protein [Halobacteriales archaeon Cl-PHB]
MSEYTASEDATRQRSFSHPLPGFVHWLVGALLAIGGLALLVGATALTFVVDRELIAEGVATGQVESTLTDAQTVEVAGAVSTWTGIGLFLTGGLLVLVAVAYVLAQRRRGEDGSYFWTSAVLGAVVSGVLSFVPFSPVLGGAAAGYLEQPTSDRTVAAGAASGLVAMAPVMVITAFVLVGVSLGLLAADLSGLALLVGVVILLTIAFVAAVGAGLGALGGYVGGRFADPADSL